MATGRVSRRSALAAMSTVAGMAGSVGMGQSALATDAAGRDTGAVVSITDFGAVADSTGQNQGTDNGAAIQNAITHVWQQGGGIVHVPAVAQPNQNQPLETRRAYGWQGVLVLPSNVRIVGDGPGGSVLRCLNNRNTPVITVGTFGPANGASLSSCPKYPIQDIPAGAVQSQVVCRDPGDAGHFVLGDVVAIEGGGPSFSKPDQHLPNMAARVTGVDPATGTVTLDHGVDDGEGMGYVAHGGAVPGIRKLGNGQANAWTDCTGRKWPLFVAMNAGVEHLAIDVPNVTGWAIFNLSTYGCAFRHLELNGNYLAGDPVAYTQFEDIHLKYYGCIFEGAYLSHDTVFRDCTFTRHPVATGKVQNVPLIWINQAEGGKRCHFERISITDRADVRGLNTVQALGLRGGSSVSDSRITIPKGSIGYAQGQSEIRDSVLLCDASTICAINLEGASLINCRVQGGNLHTVIADGTCQIRDNIVGDQSSPPRSLRSADTIHLRNDAQRSVVRGNVTAKYSGHDTIWSNAWSRKPAVGAGSVMLADVPPAAFDRLLDAYWVLKGGLWITLTGQGNGRLALVAYDGQGHMVELCGMAVSGGTGFQHLEFELFHHGPGNNIAAWSMRMSGQARVQAAGAGSAGSALSGDQICGFGLRLSGMAAGDTAEVAAGEITLTPVSTY